MILIFLLVTNISIHPEYYTNTNYFYEITGKDSIIYGATSGGVVAFNYLKDAFKVLTNSDGLQTNRQSCIALDSSGYLWVGNELGLAQIDQNFSDVQIYPNEHLISEKTQVIVCLNDSIYIGSLGGLLFIDTKGTPADFTDDERIRIFLDLYGLPSNNVQSIAIGDTAVWVGTDDGLVGFTKDFNTATIYNTSSGLLSACINKIVVIDTIVYVGTDLGLNRFNGTGFDTLLSGYEINDISYLGDSLVLSLIDTLQIGFYYQDTLIIINNGLPGDCKVLSLTNMNSVSFCGLGNRHTKDYYGRGIGRYDPVDNIWCVSVNKCLASNHISDITANEYGVFLACGARGAHSRGFGWLNNYGEWSNFTRDSILSSDHIHRCVTAPDKKVWFGHNAISGSNRDTIMAFSYDPLDDDDPFNDEWNFIRIRYKDMDSTVGVWDLKFDKNNNMFLTLAGPSDKLWVIDSALNSVYFLGERSPGFKVEIAIDSTGKIWQTVTGADGGLIMIDTRNTLFDRNDDYVFKYGVSEGLISKYAWGCIVDKNDNLYVANETGLLIYDGQDFTGITNISNEELFDVELDSEGRVWIMGRNGIYYYDPEFNVTSGWQYSDIGVHIEFMEFGNEVTQVQGFEFDSLRSCFWLAGETGLLKLEVQFDTLPGLGNILIYPNPVVDKDIVRIKNIPLDSRVNIYTISGRLIVENLAPGAVFGEVVWEIPDDVGSGLYFALIKSTIGNKVCKFAIVK